MAAGFVWNEAENFPYADGNPYVGSQAIVEGVFGRIVADWDYWALDLQDNLQDGNRIAFSAITTPSTKKPARPSVHSLCMSGKLWMERLRAFSSTPTRHRYWPRCKPKQPNN